MLEKLETEAENLGLKLNIEITKILANLDNNKTIRYINGYQLNTKCRRIHFFGTADKMTEIKSTSRNDKTNKNGMVIFRKQNKILKNRELL